MHIDHVVDGLKRGGKLVCHRCGSELDPEKWGSEWDPNHPENHHYKSHLCTCGKKNWVRINFPGSGHDKVLLEEEKSIESAIRAVKEGVSEAFKK